jgi:Tol biopolymer transport system component
VIGSERRGRGALRLIAAIGFALLAVSLSAAHAAPGRSGRLLLLTCDPTAESQHASQIRTMLPNGRDFRTIAKFESTSNYCYVDRAAWSPNGRTILYSTGTDVWTIRRDGKQRRRLLDAGDYAAWSPNGREIVFTQRVEDGKAALFRVRRDGGGLRRIMPGLESDVYAPSWSPDGRTIAFTRYYHGEESIWTVGANGSRLRQVNPRGRWPDWSPDGKRIIFTDRLSVWTMAPGGDRRRRLTPQVLEVETLQATYSPDGRRIAFVRGWRAWVMTAGGKHAHIVSPVDTVVGQVDWQPR